MVHRPIASDLPADRDGVVSTEYAIILGIVALGIVASFALLSAKIVIALTGVPI